MLDRYIFPQYFVIQLCKHLEKLKNFIVNNPHLVDSVINTLLFLLYHIFIPWSIHQAILHFDAYQSKLSTLVYFAPNTLACISTRAQYLFTVLFSFWVTILHNEMHESYVHYLMTINKCIYQTPIKICKMNLIPESSLMSCFRQSLPPPPLPRGNHCSDDYYYYFYHWLVLYVLELHINSTISVCTLLSTTSFTVTWHNVFEIHPCCVYQ